MKMKNGRRGAAVSIFMGKEAEMMLLLKEVILNHMQVIVNTRGLV